MIVRTGNLMLRRIMRSWLAPAVLEHPGAVAST